MNAAKNVREIEKLYFDEIKEHEFTKSVAQDLAKKYEELRSACCDLFNCGENHMSPRPEHLQKIKLLIDLDQ